MEILELGLEERAVHRALYRRGASSRVGADAFGIDHDGRFHGADGPRRRGPTAILLTAGTGGLEQDCVAICHQITTLNRAELSHRIGTLPEAALRAVESGIRAAIDLEA